MKNKYFEKFDSIIKIKITGINIDNYIKRIIKRKINIIKLIPVSHKEAHLILKYEEYKKLTKHKSTYEVSIINNYGKMKIKNVLKKNKILIICLIFSALLIKLLASTIFSIDIIHSDKQIRNLIKQELTKNNIKKYTFKKTYDQLEKIEDKILENNKDKLEWIEIEESGTKYIVRIEERKLNNEEEKYQYQSIVATKSAIITEVDAISGEIVKNINDYVKKGDTIISGYITHPNNSQTPTMAKGVVYGEVWYTIKIDYPYAYQEENLTGRTKTVYVLNFINKRLSLFNFDKYKSFKTKDTILLSNSLLNINLIKEKQYELKVIDEIYTEDEVISKAIDYSKDKLQKENKNIKKIKEVKILSQDSQDSHISLKLFIKAIENIGEISPIDPDKTPETLTE